MFLKFDFHNIFLILICIYEIYFIEFKCGFKYNFTKYYQNILNS